jgi:hypothetical protein
VKSSRLVVIGFVMLLALPVVIGDSHQMLSIDNTYSPSSDGIVPGVKYVWQEINGFCAWAATAMAMQAAGVDVNLYDVFAASTIGFSFAYFSMNDTRLLFPGALYTQVEPAQFLADLYGLNYTLYLGSTVPTLEQVVQVYQSEGVNVGVIDGQTEAFNLMRNTIDSGYPLLISVDPTWLPSDDYDIFREQGLTGGGHAVLIVGYDDATSTALIMDPGVGSFGDNFGYPEDGRGNYTEIHYTQLNNAWSNRYYISNLFKPGSYQVPSYDDALGRMIRDKLLGIGTIYSPSSVNAYIGKFGYSAFRAMSQDFTAEGIAEYLSIFDGMADERNFKASLILFLGLGLEAQVTLQYLSYRTALEALPSLLPDVNLTDFLAAADDALVHFDALDDNSTLTNPGNLTAATGFVSSTYRTIADLYNSTGDLAGALSAFSTSLSQISSHLEGIGDSWKAAGDVLKELWPYQGIGPYLPVIAFAGGGVAVLLVLTVFWTKKRPSQ